MAGELIEGLRPQSQINGNNNKATLGGPGISGQNIKTRLGQHTITGLVATNYVLWSNSLTNVAWTKSNVTLVADFDTSPKVDSMATKVTPTSPAAYISQAIAEPFVSGDTLYAIVWVRALDGQETQVTLTISDTEHSDAQSYDVDDNWLRITAKITKTTTSTPTIKLAMAADVLVYNMQVTDTYFRMGLESLGVPKEYYSLIRIERFFMTESNDGSEMVESPTSTTAVMLEDI